MFLYLDVIKGCDPKDSTTLPRPLSKSKLKSTNKFDKICVGIPKEFHCPGMSSEVIEGNFFENFTKVAQLTF